MSNFPPRMLLVIHREDILQLLTKYGFERPQVAMTTMDDPFPTVLMRAFYPSPKDMRNVARCEKALAKLVNKPVMLRDKFDARDDKLQKLAEFGSLP